MRVAADRWLVRVFCALLIAVPLASAARAEDAPPWGPEQNGLRTRLLPVQKAHVAGAPARFRLELKNCGAEARVYDKQQADCNDAFRIVDPLGKPLPYVGGSYQTGGTAKSLAPGKTVTLFDNLDLANQYLFTVAGQYQLQFRGKPAWRDKQTPLPPSNTLVVSFGAGELPLSQQAPARLLGVLPKGWHISLNQRVSEVDDEGRIAPPGYARGPGTSLAIRNEATYKNEVLRVELWIARQSLAIKAEPRGDVADASRRNATYLGEGLDGHVYIWIAEGVERQWPQVRQQVGAALGIRSDRAGSANK